MTVTAVDIRHENERNLPSLGLDRATRDALATYARLRWPSGTAKAVAREFDLSMDEARGLVAGRASQTTVDKIWKHPNGGWDVILPVLGAVVGHGVHQHFRKQAREAARAEREAQEHERLATAAYERLPKILAWRPGEDWASPEEDGGVRRSA